MPPKQANVTHPPDLGRQESGTGLAGRGLMREAKSKLREVLRAERERADPAALSERSARLCARAVGHPAYLAARRVALFVGVKGEPDTLAIVGHALHSGKEVFLPRVLSREAVSFARLAAIRELVPAGFGLLEPPESAPMLSSLSDLELVFVPGVAFDRAGARLGQGRGHYDRILSALACPTIGACFARFLEPPEGPIPMDTHDRRVDHVVTEDEAIDCRSAQARS